MAEHQVSGASTTGLNLHLVDDVLCGCWIAWLYFAALFIHKFILCGATDRSDHMMECVVVQNHQKEDFEYYSPILYLGQWIAYAKMWVPIQEMWEAGTFTNARPQGQLMPLGGLYQGVKWSRDTAQAKQLDLIGTWVDLSQDGTLRLALPHLLSLISWAPTILLPFVYGLIGEVSFVLRTPLRSCLTIVLCNHRLGMSAEVTQSKATQHAMEIAMMNNEGST
eukprot:SAG31_NODE_63_length_28659_cov_23.074685_3_plen_222_part_00